MSVGIADLRAVDDQRVIVKAGNERGSGDRPESILLLFHVDLRTAPEIQSHLRRIGSLHANLYSPGAVNPRILRCPHVGGGGLKIARFLCTAKACEKNNCHSDLLHLYSFSLMFHLVALKKSTQRHSKEFASSGLT